MILIILIPLLFLFLLLPGLILIYTSTVHFKKNLKPNAKQKGIVPLSFKYASLLVAISGIVSFLLLFIGSVLLLQGILLIVNILGVIAAIIFAISSRMIIKPAKKNYFMFVLYFNGIMLMFLLVFLNLNFSLGCTLNPAGCG